MGRRGAPKAGESKSALAKTLLQKKVLRKNGASIAAQKGVDKYGKDGKKFNSATALAGPDNGAESKSLRSVMEMASVDEFLVHARLTKREFEARRGWFDDVSDSTTVVKRTPHTVTMLGEGDPEDDPWGKSAPKPYEWHALPMPERPPWSHRDTAAALEQREVESFVDWRRKLAATEERVMAAQEAEAARLGKPLSGGMAGQAARMTPYEKNMEVWRQLWRVVERSDVLVQVVDARQPLFYYSQQLHDYSRTHFRGSRARSGGGDGGSGGSGGEVTEMASAEHVERLMVLNKADFLTSSQRRVWSRELRQRGLRFVWFSAKMQQEKLNLAEREARRGFSEEEVDPSGGTGDNEEDHEEEDAAAAAAAAAAEEAAWNAHMSKALDGGEAALTDDEEDEDDDDEEEEDDEEDSDHDSQPAAGSGNPKKKGDTGSEKTSGAPRHPSAASAASASEDEVAARETMPTGGGSGGGGAEEEEKEVEELSRVIEREELLRVLEALSLTAEANRSTSSHGCGGRGGGGGGDVGGGAVKRAQVGIVGYPNVGKSSVINVLLGATPLNHSSLRVATGASPGKTKHFQTLDLPPLPPRQRRPPDSAVSALRISSGVSPAPAAAATTTTTPPPPLPAPAAVAGNAGKSSATQLQAGAPLSPPPPAPPPEQGAKQEEGVGEQEEEAATEKVVLMTLCDCPGLVFPQFVSSAAEMLLAGVLPVAQLRDHNPPMRLLCSRIPTAVFELTYGFKAPKVGYDGLDPAGGERDSLAAASAAARAGAGGKEEGESNLQVGLCEFLTVEATLVGVGRARSWFASGNRGEVDRSRVARLLLSDAQTGKLLACLPPPLLAPGTREHASFVATTHRARLSELRKRKKLLLPAAAPPVNEEEEEEEEEEASTRGGGGGGGFAEADDETEASLAAAFAAHARAGLSSSSSSCAGSGGHGGGCGGDDDDLWMDMELSAELEGDAGGKVTRLRASKNAKMDRKAHKLLHGKKSGKAGKKGRRAFGDDPYGEGGGGGSSSAGVHMAGRKANHGNSAPVGLRGVAVLPHHPSYNSAGDGE